MKTNQLPSAFYTATSWLLQNLCYYACRWYFFQLKCCSLKANKHLSKIKKPLILATAPHQSHLDVVLVPASIPRHLLPVRWLADKKIFTTLPKQLWLKLWGAIPAQRDTSGTFSKDDIQWILDFAGSGKCLGIFPECCLVGGRFGDPHRDLVAEALRRNISVVPVSLIGNDHPDLTFLRGTNIHKVQVSIRDPLSEADELLDSLTS